MIDSLFPMKFLLNTSSPRLSDSTTLTKALHFLFLFLHFFHFFVFPPPSTPLSSKQRDPDFFFHFPFHFFVHRQNPLLHPTYEVSSRRKYSRKEKTVGWKKGGKEIGYRMTGMWVPCSCLMLRNMRVNFYIKERGADRWTESEGDN